MELLSVPCVPSNADWGLVATALAIRTMRSFTSLTAIIHFTPSTHPTWFIHTLVNTDTASTFPFTHMGKRAIVDRREETARSWKLKRMAC